MKLFSSFLFCFFLATSLQAQLGFDFSTNGQFNSTWLINKNTYDAGAEQDYAPSWGSNFGLGFGLRMGAVGLGLETNWGKHNAEFTGDYLSQNYTSKISLKTFQLPVFLRFQNKGGGYFELGAQFNNVRSAMYSQEGLLLAPATSDATNEYAKSYSTAFLGFGINRKIIKDFPLGFVFGVRLQYGIKDAEGVDALGRSLSSNLVYPDYQKTSAAAAGFHFGLMYTIDTKKQKSGY